MRLVRSAASSTAGEHRGHQRNELLGKSSGPERTYIEEVMPAKLALDLQYVKERSIARNFGIVYGTLRRLFAA